MNKLTNYTTIEELRTAKRILHSKKAALELDMKDDLDELKESLKPAKVLSRLVAGGNHGHNGTQNESENGHTQGFLYGAGAAVTDLLVNDLFLRKSGYIKKFAMSYIIRLIAPVLFENAGPMLKKFMGSVKTKA